MRSKLFTLVAVLVVVSMMLGACATATPQAPKATAVPAKVETLRVNIGSFPENIDPQKASFVNEIAHLKLAYEGLTRLDKDLKTVPAAAEKWVFNATATEVVFTLRKGLTYSDGSLLNAKRFEYSILRNVNPATAGEYAQITDDIAGAAAWRGADLKKATPDELKALQAAVKVQALDAAGAPCKDYAQADCLTLKIGLQQAAPYFATVMGLWVTFPAKEELITKGGDNWWLDAKNHLGNGPFVMTTLEQNVKGLFVPNTKYWAGIVKYNVEYRYIVDGAVAFAAYKNNEFDVVGLGAEDLKTAEADAVLKTEKTVYPGACTYAIMFHQLKEPFTDPKVRQAFTQAIDRQGWVTDVLKGLGAPTLTWIPKGFPGYDANETRWGYDVEAAKKALAESTYKTADKLPPVTVTFSDSPRNRTRWEYMSAKWKAALGVDVKLNPVEPTTYTGLTKNVATAPQMFILGWCADYPDPQNWLSVYWMTGAFGARIGYSNPDLDKMLKQADSTVDDAARMKLYADAQKKLGDTVPVAFMWNNVNSYLVKSYVKGVNKTPQDSAFPGDNDPLSITIVK